MVNERKGGLSRERILEAAASVVQSEGQAALSMRRLAQELDVWPMSVYRYFRDKDELLGALAERAAAGVGRSPGTGPWRERMRVLLLESGDAIAGDPDGLGARMAQAFLSPALLRISESGMAILRDAGFDPAEAARAWRALWAYTYGAASLRIAATPAESNRLARAAVAALPDEEFPVLLAGADEFAVAVAGEDEFERGLDVMLRGLGR